MLKSLNEARTAGIWPFWQALRPGPAPRRRCDRPRLPRAARSARTGASTTDGLAIDRDGPPALDDWSAGEHSQPQQPVECVDVETGEQHVQLGSIRQLASQPERVEHLAGTDPRPLTDRGHREGQQRTDRDHPLRSARRGADAVPPDRESYSKDSTAARGRSVGTTRLAGTTAAVRVRSHCVWLCTKTTLNARSIRLTYSTAGTPQNWTSKSQKLTLRGTLR